GGLTGVPAAVRVRIRLVRVGYAGAVVGPVPYPVAVGVGVPRVATAGDVHPVGQPVAVGVGVPRIVPEPVYFVAIRQPVAVDVGEGLEVHDVGLLGGREAGERAAEEPHEVLGAHSGVSPRGVLRGEVHEEDTRPGGDGDGERERDVAVARCRGDGARLDAGE